MIVAAPPLILQRAFASRPSGDDGKPWTAVQASDPALGIKKAPLQETIAGLRGRCMGGWGAMPYAPTLAGFGFVMGPSQVYALGSFRGAFAFNHAAITEACVAKFWGVSAVLAGEKNLWHDIASHRRSTGWPAERVNGRLKEGSTKPEVSIVDRVYVPNRRGAASAFRSARSVALKGRVEVSLSFCIR